jgi:hypothetical protein
VSILRPRHSQANKDPLQSPMRCRREPLISLVLVVLLLGLAVRPCPLHSEGLVSVSSPCMAITGTSLSIDDGLAGEVTISLLIEGLLSTLECPVRFSLVTFSSAPDLLMSGFEFRPLGLESWPVVDTPLGLAIDRIFSFPYAYVNGTMNYDYWDADLPQYEMYRPDLFWTTTSSEGNWLGAVFLSNLTSPVTIGEYLWLDGIQVCLSSDQPSVCTPSQLLLWAEFSWDLTAWSVQTAVWDSLNKANVIGNTTVLLSASTPFSQLGLGLIASGLVIPLCAGGLYFRKRATRVQLKNHKAS